MEVGGTAELRSWILSFGAGAEVLEPVSLRAEVTQELEACLARYGGGEAKPAASARRGESDPRQTVEGGPTA